eukprot:TRINITY_DN1269_c0_g2_i2.p1 TRINITY_DN1269_c0_g2~~TRINITY_DN1269_c0_g2_i2.p1  ORF type:complete len:354 (-),score=72.90 TRINITY_DN1269_c0_g2_i2:37-1098(-)
MNYLHHMDILHRDLKSDNVLVTTYGRCKIADFGLASKTNLQSRKLSYGTPFWIAPEVIDHHKSTKKSDIYSYGILLNEIVCRELPYSSQGLEDEEMVMKNVVYSNLRPNNPDWCPKKYNDLCNICWSSTIDERPTFDEIIQILQDIQSNTTDIVPVLPYVRTIQVVFEDEISIEEVEEAVAVKSPISKRISNVRLKNFILHGLLQKQNRDGSWSYFDSYEEKVRHTLKGINFPEITDSINKDIYVTFINRIFINYILGVLSTNSVSQVKVTRIKDKGTYSTTTKELVTNNMDIISTSLISLSKSIAKKNKGRPWGEWWEKSSEWLNAQEPDCSEYFEEWEKFVVDELNRIFAE